MSISLKDQLLGLGFTAARPAEKQSAKPPIETKNPICNRQHSPQTKTPSRAKTAPQNSTEMDLAKAFAMRQVHDKKQREAIEQEKLEKARQKKIAKEVVAKILDGKILNDTSAEIARHFTYAGKIKRVYVTASQLLALNAGELGVVQHNGRFCIVAPDVIQAISAQLPALVALFGVSENSEIPTDYADPKFDVPDDLIW